MMIETEENRMEIEARERVVFDESRYYGDEGREVSATDLMEREGIDEIGLLARFTEDDIFCHAMDLLDFDLQEEMDCLALYFDEASSRSYFWRRSDTEPASPRDCEVSCSRSAIFFQAHRLQDHGRCASFTASGTGER